jgi:hypothetical protein
MGIGELLKKYHQGEIDADQFVEMSHLVAADAAIVGLAAAAGQVLVPIPVVGALVGSLAGKVVASALKDGLGASEAALLARLEDYEQWATAQLDDHFRALLSSLDSYFGDLAHLAQVAFDEEVNTTLRLAASVQYAEAVGVADELILRTTSAVDVFMTE